MLIIACLLLEATSISLVTLETDVISPAISETNSILWRLLLSERFLMLGRASATLLISRILSATVLDTK